MRYPYYKAEIIDINGETIEEIDDIISLEAARAFNVEGAATLVLPDHYQRSLFRMHQRMKLWRYDYTGKPLNFGDTIWFLTKKDHAISEHTITLSWVDAFGMLKTRLVAYTSVTPYADKTLDEFALITFNDALRIDSMMIAYMKENFGNLAIDTDRTSTYIEIPLSKNLGPYGEKQAAWQEMDAVLSDLASQAGAAGMNIYYDLIPAPGGVLNFRVWTTLRGIDRRPFIVLNDTDGMIDDIHEVEDWTEVATVCYALGYDSGPSQVIESVESPLLIRTDPFGRIEMTVNAPDSEEPTVLRMAARAALNGRRPKRQVTARVVENNALRYGDIVYGDLLKVEVAGQQYDVALNAVRTRWDASSEDLEMRLAGEAVFGPLLTGGLPDPGIEVPGVNTRPIVDAGDDQAIALTDTLVLAGSAVDDGNPDPPAELTYLWTQVSGPGTVVFVDATDPETSATVDSTGTYVLRLTASDSALTDADEMTVEVAGEPTTPPDFGLIEGVDLVAGISRDGKVYRTTNFTNATPTWDEVDLGLPFVYSGVVNPFCDGYILGTGMGDINAWIVDDTDIYFVDDLFGTPGATSVFTFDEATVNADFHWRTIQASFGAFFAEGDNPWILVTSYYGNTAGHEGTWAIFSINGGATWSTEVQINADPNQTTPDRFNPHGVYTSPKTPGLAYTATFNNVGSGLPRFGTRTNGGSFVDEGLSAVHSTFALREAPPTGTDTVIVFIGPPADAARMIVEGDWFALIDREGLSGGTGGGSLELGDPASVARTDDLSYTPPTFGVPVLGTFTAEYTFSGGDWPGNRDSMLITPPTGDSNGVNLEIRATAQSTGSAGVVTNEVRVTLRVTEIELDNGFIYNPSETTAQAYISEDWGETWATTALFEPGSKVFGSIHLPWPTNDDEDLAYHGFFESVDGERHFRLMRVLAGTPTDISPNDGSRDYGVNRYGFAVRTYDSDRTYVVASVMGNDTSDDPADDFHAVYISSDEGDTWAEVVAPLADTGAPGNRPAFECAFAGDTEQILFIYGPDQYMSYSSDFGATVDDKSGNLAALGALGFVMIAGGPTGP